MDYPIFAAERREWSAVGARHWVPAAALALARAAAAAATAAGRDRMETDPVRCMEEGFLPKDVAPVDTVHVSPGLNLKSDVLQH